MMGGWMDDACIEKQETEESRVAGRGRPAGR